MELVLTAKAHAAIVKQCAAALHTETGGILVGRRIDQSLIAPFAIGPGPRAQKCLGHYSPDVEWQQGNLEKICALYGLNYIGSYHKHPGWYRKPSLYDCRTVREILSSPKWNISEGVFPIVIVKSSRVEIYPYYFSQDSTKYRPISWRKIPSQDPLVREALQRRIA